MERVESGKRYVQLLTSLPHAALHALRDCQQTSATTGTTCTYWQHVKDFIFENSKLPD